MAGELRRRKALGLHGNHRGLQHPLAEFLAGQGWPVSVVNPARFAREKQPAPWAPRRRHPGNDPDGRNRQGTASAGIAEATAAHLLVALSPHYGFKSAKQAVAHAGRDVRIRQSGQWAGHSKITKCGDPLALRPSTCPPSPPSAGIRPSAPA